MVKKNAKSTMGEFLPESTVSSILPIVKANESFIMKERGKTVYIGMLLDVALIGGISKKSVNDKDKGGVIELIKNGNIDAYITQELNDSNLLLFIPTVNTIDRLGDYGVFRKVSKYEFVKLNDKLEIIERTEVFGGYDVFRAIVTGNEQLSDYIQADEAVTAGSADDPTLSPVTKAVNKGKDVAAAAAEKLAPVAAKLAPMAGKLAPVGTKIKEAVKDKFENSAVMKDMMPEQNDESGENKASEKDKTETAAENTSEEQAATEKNKAVESASAPVPQTVPSSDDTGDIVYTETQVLTSVERVFHADNLDLPLSSEPFDQLFTISNHLIKFNVDTRDTYVNERLNLMAAAANRDLEKLRADNLKKLRDKYFMLMSARILEIQALYDIKNASTQCGRMKAGLDAQKSADLENISELVAKRQEIIKTDYNTRLEEFCDAKAKEARSEFKSRYETVHNQTLNSVEKQVRADIEVQYTMAMSDLYTARRNDALSMLDVNITGVLQELSNEYKKMFDAETALYEARAKEMREYAKELHQEDAKRLAVEEEHNRISNEVNEARAEASAKIELIRKEYETAQAALEARAAATIESAENKTQFVQEQLELRTKTLMSDRDAIQKQLDEALERADKAQEIVRADYERRLVQAQDDRDSWKQTLDAYKDQHRHNNRLAAILVIAITIAAVAGGFVAGGVYWNRIVAGELTGGNNSSEIKIIEPARVIEQENDETESDMSDVSDDNIDTEDDESVQSDFDESEASETEESEE